MYLHLFSLLHTLILILHHNYKFTRRSHRWHACMRWLKDITLSLIEYSSTPAFMQFPGGQYTPEKTRDHRSCCPGGQFILGIDVRGGHFNLGLSVRGDTMMGGLQILRQRHKQDIRRDSVSVLNSSRRP